MNINKIIHLLMRNVLTVIGQDVRYPALLGRMLPVTTAADQVYVLVETVCSSFDTRGAA